MASASQPSRSPGSRRVLAGKRRARRQSSPYQAGRRPTGPGRRSARCLSPCLPRPQRPWQGHCPWLHSNGAVPAPQAEPARETTVVPERSEALRKRAAAQAEVKRIMPAHQQALYDSLLDKKRRLWEEVHAFIKKEREGKPREDFEFSPEEGRGVVDLASEAEYVLVRRKNEELFRIEDTLRRIEEGDYGVCLDCGLDIPPRRLELMPEAVRCTQCQERLERAEKKHF